MKRIWKHLIVVTVMIMAMFTMKVDVQAEKIWNTAGEKDPWGEDYSYKYWDGHTWTYCGDGTFKEEELIDITYDVTYDYEEAYKMLEYVNAERRKAGVPELIMKDELMDVAMQRAAECVMYFGHIRPDAFGYDTISMFAGSENIHMGCAKAEAATGVFANSKGHYKNMINSMWDYVGFGCVKSNGRYFWVQIFSIANLYYEDGFDLYNPEKNQPVEWEKMSCYERTNFSEKVTMKLNPKLYSEMNVTWSENNPYIGEEEKPTIRLYYSSQGYKSYAVIPLEECDVSFSHDKLIENTEKGFRYVDAGTTTVTFSLKDYPQFKATKKINIREKKGSVITRNGCQYKVTNTAQKTVSLIQGADRKKVVIPKSIKIGNRQYKVTKIANKAFQGMTQVKEVTIGAKVTGIGKEAFRDCRNLKKITVKSSNLKSVGKNAFKGIHKKAVIKVPKSKLKKYKVLIKGKGQKKTVKIKQ